LKLSELAKTDPIFWKTLGELLCNKIRDRVQKKHRNVNSELFEEYDADYATKKSNNEAGRSGTPQASFSTTPDMTFSGKTMADLKVISSTKNDVRIGWWEIYGDIIRKLHKHKNYRVVNFDQKPYFSADEETWLEKQLSGAIDKNIKKYCSTPLTIQNGERL